MSSPIPKGANPSFHLLCVYHGARVAPLVAARHEGPGLCDVRRLLQDDLASGQFVPEIGVGRYRVCEVGPLALQARVHHVHGEDLEPDFLVAGEYPDGAVILGEAARRVLREWREHGAVGHVVPVDDEERAIGALRAPGVV